MASQHCLASFWRQKKHQNLMRLSSPIIIAYMQSMCPVFYNESGSAFYNESGSGSSPRFITYRIYLSLVTQPTEVYTRVVCIHNICINKFSLWLIFLWSASNNEYRGIKIQTHYFPRWPSSMWMPAVNCFGVHQLEGWQERLSSVFWKCETY